MKRFWLVLLSLGLVLAFSASAMAVDVKFSGDFTIAGMYLDKTKLVKDTAADGPSTAFYYQRLRVRTDFVVSTGLTLITRFDAMERVWGGARGESAASTTAGSDLDSAGTKTENQNIAFDWAYINYVSPIGIFDIGLMEDGRTGTVFGDSYSTAGRIKWNNTFGPFTLKADITKVKDTSNTAITTATAADVDDDKYGVEGVYQWKDGKAGMKVTYYRYASKRVPVATGYQKTYWQFTPYTIAKIGPVDIQAELNWAKGKLQDTDTGSSTPNKDLDNLSGWIDATAAFGPVYFGGTFAYVSGDDPGSTDKQEGGTLTGGRDWMPCLIMWNYDRTNWAGPLNGYTGGTTTAAQDTNMSNAWFFQGRAGVKPVAALDIMASVSYANADKKPTAAWLYNSYGWEVDVTGTYKITNNLSYMLGVGYLFTGDYYKAESDANKIGNDYLVINKLTLTY